MRIGCVVMAAGNSVRFEGNKLLTEVKGRPMVSYALDAVPAGVETAVVSQYPEILSLAADRGFLPVENKAPELGISHTIHLGLQALSHCDGVLFMVADQPGLRHATVEKLVALWREQPEKIAALSTDGKRGNPCLFPAAFFPELMALTGDTGGSRVIRRHEEQLLLLETDPAELHDIDTKDDL